MVRDLLIDIINKWHISDLILFFLLILTFTVTWLTVLTLGFRILQVEIKFTHIIPGALIGCFISAFIRPFVPGAAAFFITLLPLLICLKCYSKAKWIIASWVTIILLLSTAILPILLISPLTSVSPVLKIFFFENKFGMLGINLAETLGAALLLAFIKIFDIPLIPNPNRSLNSVDFVDIYMFFGLLFLCYYLFVIIWEDPNQFSMLKIFAWIISAGLSIAYYIHKTTNSKKIQLAENKIQELTELNLKNQQNNNKLNPTKPNIPRLELELREKKIIRSVIEGKSNKEIAAELQISKARVDNLLTPIYRKLDVDGRFQLINYFVKNDLLDWIMND